MKDKNYKLFLKAKELIKGKQYKEAIEILKKVKKDEPNDNVVKFELAKLFIKYKETMDKGKSMLLDLLNTQNKNYAILELGKLEASLNNYDEAKNYFLQLLNTQNKNYAILELGRLEASLNNYAEAKKYFLLLLNTDAKDFSLVELVFLNIKDNKIKEASDLFNKIPTNFLDSIIYINIKTYLNYKLGLDISKDRNNTYFTMQLFNYNKEFAISHISKHLDENNKKRIHTTFDESINLYELFDEIQEKIKNMEPTQYSFTEKYIVCYNHEIATIGDKRTKYVQVITLPNSKNILTMYPINIMEKQKGKMLIKKEN